MMNKIIFLDLDNTLWHFEQIPTSALEAIQKARKNGHKVFTNTGRSRCECPDFLWDLDFDGYCFSAGSEIYIGKERVLYHPLDVMIVKKCTHILRSMNVGFSLEGSNMTFSNDKNRERMKQFQTDNRMGNRFLSFPDISLMKENDYEQIMKFSVHFEDIQQREVLLKQLPDSLVFTTFRHLGGEATDKNYNKATAIEFVQNYFDHQYESIAMGDSENDLPMLSYANISVAMGNGCDEVKEKATYVTDRIDNDGLYKAFQYLKLI